MQASASAVCDQDILVEKADDSPEHAPRKGDEDIYPNYREFGYDCEGGHAGRLPLAAAGGHGRATTGLALPSVHDLGRPSPVPLGHIVGRAPSADRPKRDVHAGGHGSVGSPLPPSCGRKKNKTKEVDGRTWNKIWLDFEKHG